MTITSVVLGDGTPEGGWGEAWVCASTDAAGSIVIRRGKSSFMVYLDSVWLLVRPASFCKAARTLDVFWTVAAEWNVNALFRWRSASSALIK
jgi:hypothetical protein